MQKSTLILALGILFGLQAPAAYAEFYSHTCRCQLSGRNFVLNGNGHGFPEARARLQELALFAVQSGSDPSAPSHRAYKNFVKQAQECSDGINIICENLSFSN